MKKIPTLFVRGEDGRITGVWSKECLWVLVGEGIASRKLDGTCCLVDEGKLYRRREIRQGDKIPEGFTQVDHDPVTGKAVGWVPVGDGPDDRWHREAFNDGGPWENGTYELCGPKIQGNPEGFDQHYLWAHAGLWAQPFDVPDRSAAGLRAFLDGKDMEGIVFRHPDGRMAKIKLKDFGLKRGGK